MSAERIRSLDDILADLEDVAKNFDGGWRAEPPTMAALVRRIIRELRATRQDQEVRAVLAAGDIASLPLDYSTQRMAQDRMERIAELEAEIKNNRESLASLMIHKSLATGHGQTFACLLIELAWQIDELREKR